MLRLIAILCCSIVLSTAASAAELVRYQAKEWQGKHIHDAEKVKTIAETLTNLGCEVTKHDHNGHTDLKYRCEEWKQLELETHEEAHQWENWLKEYGFETEHKH